MSIEAESDEAFLKRMSYHGNPEAYGPAFWTQREDIARLVALAERGAKLPDASTITALEERVRVLEESLSGLREYVGEAKWLLESKIIEKIDQALGQPS